MSDASIAASIITEDRTRSVTTERRPVRIALIAPPWYPIPPSGYGGI